MEKIISNSTKYLNQFFLNKLLQPKHILLPIVADIENQKGQISIILLAKRHFITVRKLERIFKQHVGITPKELINFVRYSFVLPVIQNKSSERSLFDIAFECVPTTTLA